MNSRRLTLGLFTLSVVVVLFLVSCSKNESQNPKEPVPLELNYRAADLSFLPEIERWSTVFYNKDSVQQDLLTILKEAGCNTVRIRLWKDPDSIQSSLSEVIALSNQIRSAGLFIWLDIHYSDTWADPAHQTKPKAWHTLPFELLRDSVKAYTYAVVNAIQPNIVQIGNEINQGFLWPDGHINNKSQFHTLLHDALTSAHSASTKCKRMLHLAGTDNANSFFQDADSLPFEQIGISYYPKWHTKDLNQLFTDLDHLGIAYNRDIFLAEVAYPFTMDWNDWTNNIIGWEQDILPEYESTIQGQAAYLGVLNRRLQQTSHGSGICYWAPDWVAYKGPTATNGSPWENQALFNFNHVALPGIDSLFQ